MRFYIDQGQGACAYYDADSHEAAHVIATEIMGTAFGYGVVPIEDPVYAESWWPRREREGSIVCRVRRDWRIRRVIDHGPGRRDWRYELQGQNLNVMPGGYGFEFTWYAEEYPSDARYDLDHATHHTIVQWRVRVHIAAQYHGGERVLNVLAYSRETAGWAATSKCYPLARHEEVTILSAEELGPLPALPLPAASAA